MMHDHGPMGVHMLEVLFQVDIGLLLLSSKEVDVNFFMTRLPSRVLDAGQHVLRTKVEEPYNKKRVAPFQMAICICMA